MDPAVCAREIKFKSQVDNQFSHHNSVNSARNYIPSTSHNIHDKVQTTIHLLCAEVHVAWQRQGWHMLPWRTIFLVVTFIIDLKAHKKCVDQL